jgi:hypothetical protein
VADSFFFVRMHDAVNKPGGMPPARGRAVFEFDFFCRDAILKSPGGMPFRGGRLRAGNFKQRGNL